MHKMNSKSITAALLVATSVYSLLSSTGLSFAAHIPVQTSSGSSGQPGMVLPAMDAQKGKQLFVNKGCVSCHAINGVGGHDAPAMDAHREMNGVNPFDFAARMWNHAPGMIAAQEEAFDELISLTGDELAHIVAFVHDDKAQHAFNEKDLTAKARKMMDHGHGDMAAPKAHAEDAGHGHEPNQGHGHAPGTPVHKD